jgi:cytochrome d ubiquinol oxidase subunit I
VLEALHLATERPAYRVLFEFWQKIFAVAFGFGVELATNWKHRRKRSSC